METKYVFFLSFLSTHVSLEFKEEEMQYLKNGIQIPHHDPHLLLLCQLGFTPILSHPSLTPSTPKLTYKAGHRIPLPNHHTPNPPRTIRSIIHPVCSPAPSPPPKSHLLVCPPRLLLCPLLLPFLFLAFPFLCAGHMDLKDNLYLGGQHLCPRLFHIWIVIVCTIDFGSSQ